eukprot:NODE_2499_length_526_cov_304.064990_g1985_i0.p2 GENE.NODE_2499_length_526_cov_304.064990_g1985_i0~~NODE_2499_length_526_cov_304.064990_g1985_i0.p2  ORF type:complete len:96 (+),score=17.90 NODE_2499_length_526_cov_304.064990_g1985_i0:106-393(+)
MRRRGVELVASDGGKPCTGPWVDYRPCPFEVPCEMGAADLKSNNNNKSAGAHSRGGRFVMPGIAAVIAAAVVALVVAMVRRGSKRIGGDAAEALF